MFIKSTVYDANQILVPVLKNVWASGQNFQNVLYLVMITKSTLQNANYVSITFTRNVNVVSAGVTVDSSGNIYAYTSYQ